MNLKKIGISLRVEKIEKFNEKRDTISHDWIKFLEMLDYMPILIPNNLKDTKEYLSSLNLDGIVLSGGDNIGDFPERDKTENIILTYAIKNSIPVLGVCRGMQIINLFFKGGISKDQSSSHVGNYHNISILDKKLTNILDNSIIKVNSFHNNLIEKNDISKELTIFAQYETDNSVEGYFHKKFPIMGVMWHPERDFADINQQKLIDTFYRKKIWQDN